MKGRIYDPQARQFLSPDPILQDPLNSQNYNRYSYVWNNPTTYTDPSGFETDGSSYWSDLDWWELSAMGGADRAASGPGGNFFNPTFNAAVTPGLDEDSTDGVPAEAPGTTLEVKGHTECNSLGVCFGFDENGNWIQRSPGAPVEYLNREVWLRAKSVSNDTARVCPTPESCVVAFGVTDIRQVLGVALMSASHASDLIGLKGLATLGTKAAIGGAKRLAAWRLAKAEAKASAAGLPPAAGVPTVTFSRSRAPGLAQNFDDAVTNGAPTRLNRVDAATRDANRRAALRGKPSAPAGQSLDEYPFACSAQGGCGSFVRAVPVAEQSYQGGVLSRFFQDYGVRPGDAFDVVFGP